MKKKTKCLRLALGFSFLFVAAKCQTLTAQTIQADCEAQAKAAAGSQAGKGQPQLAIPQSKSGCTSSHGPRQPCGIWVCLTTDNSWEDVPLKKGTRCQNSGFCDGVDVYPADCIVPVTGAIYPAYYIASVIYVPPGGAGPSASSVDYGAGSTIGTMTSTTDSWKNSLQVQLKDGMNVGEDSVGIELSFGTDWGGSTTTQADVEATIKGDVKVSGPGSDSINHNYDQILLLLGPEIDVVMNGEGNAGLVQWGLNFSRAVPQVVLVGWLNGAMTMPSDVASTLSQYGITSQDYTQMLSADPFANDSAGAGKPAAARFEYNTVLPYEPISGQYTQQDTNSYTSSTNDTTSVNYSVGAAVSVSAVGQSLKVSDTFTWENSSSQKATTGSSETETFVVSGPSSAYTGPTDMYIYVDKIYKTFLFSFLSPSGSATSHYSKRRKR